MQRVDAGFRAWTDFVQRRGWWIIALVILLSLGSFFYVRGHLGINANTAELFDPELPFRQERERLNAAFPQFDDVLLVVVESPVPEHAFLVAERLQASMQAEPALFESVYWPAGDAFFRRNGLLFRDVAELADLGNRLAETQPFLAALQRDPSLRGLFGRLTEFLENANADQRAALEPFFEALNTVVQADRADPAAVLSWQSLMDREDAASDDRARELLLVRPVLDYTRVRPARQPIERVRALAATIEADGVFAADVRLTGELALKHEEIEAATTGAIQAGILSFILVSLVLTWSLRSFGLIVSVLVTLICGLLLTAAFAALAVGSLNMISIAFAVLYIGLGVDYAIHLCLHFREELVRGRTRPAALTEALRDVGPSLLLCTLSTMIGFFAFVPTGFAGVAELGLIAGVGMLLSFVVSLTLLPSLLRKWPVRPKLLSELTHRHDRHRLVQLPQNKPAPFRWAALLLGLVALALLPMLQFDYDPLNLRDPQSESVVSIRELIEEEVASPYTVEFLFEQRDAAAQVHARLKADPDVAQVVWLEDFVPPDQDARLAQVGEMNLLLGGLFWDVSEPLPAPTTEAREAALRTFLDTLKNAGSESVVEKRLRSTLESFLAELPEAAEARAAALQTLEADLLQTFTLALDNLAVSLEAEGIEVESLPASVRERWVNTDGLFRVQAYPEAALDSPQKRQAFVRQLQVDFPRATGDLITTVESGAVVLEAFRMALLLAVGAIALLLVSYLRSLRETILILTPLLLAGLLTAATLSVLEVPFNFANVIALPLLLGFGVDNGIHVIQRVRRRGEGDLLTSCTARAVFFSSLTTLFSFGNLAFSPHRGTATLGWVLTLGVVFTLLATLVILPAFLSRREDRQANTG
ncbi:MAG: MMPL family transporter [Opitutales bacterium]